MTLTDPAPPALVSELLTAAPAALSAIAGADGWTVQPDDASLATPSPDARTVEGRVGDARIRLVVDPALARHLQVGPPPADDLVQGALPALLAVVAALGEEPTALVDVREATGEPTGPGLDMTAVTFHDEASHRATLVLLVPAAAAPPVAPEPAPTATPASATAPRLSSVPSGLELLHDVELAVTVELGRTRMLVRDVLDLVPGSVIELDRAAGSPVDVLVNGTMIARGEVVVIDEEFGVRITEVVGHEDEPAR
ncbi:MAG: flagellar motor switch protein FliN [Actinomycetota bacterium]|nr:flagellar motor switch protein FliN [Actinomycetota bacterium]